MVVVLSVAEKPSVAKELANIIGQGAAHRRNGHSPYNHVYDIPNCQFNGQQVEMKITSVLGHMMEYEFREPFKKWNSCKPEELFEAPMDKTVKKDMLNVERTLHDESRKCGILFLWLDCDLEGENIAFEVINICKSANPRLNVYRARFSALIPRDVFAAMSGPQRPNHNMSEAVDARQEIDLRLGAAFTRFQTQKLQSKFYQLANIVISYGPCQFPTLGFVVERYLERQNFIPEDFWSIACSAESDDPDEPSGKLSCNFRWTRGSIFDRLTCTLLYEICVNAGHAVVTECSARTTSRFKPFPLNTIELQRRASRFLRMGSDETMAAAEALYQRGILSYPRTETDFFKEGFDLIVLIEEHSNHADWGDFCRNLVHNNGFEYPKAGGHDDQAHPPIHPTKSVPLNEIADPKERGIYELVTRHFLACCSKDAKGDQTTIRIQFMGNKTPLGNANHSNANMHSNYNNINQDMASILRMLPGEVFEATGLMIRERHWLDVYRWERWTANKVPVLSVGDIVKPKRLEMTEGRTVAPPPISESDLISEMDKNGIGTDATIASHIKTIQDRKYAFKDADSRFVPTELGIALVEGYNKMGYQLNKPYLRAAMEKDCQKISRGELSKQEMVESCLRFMKECFLTCRREGTKLDEAVEKYLGHNNGAHGGGNDEISFTVSQRNISICGHCLRKMDLKTSDGAGAVQKRLLHCRHCAKTYILPSKGEITPHEHTCPICNFQVLTIRNTETGKSHTLCPMCFKNPPGPPDAEEGISDMRCFSCAHNCPLAGARKGDSAVVAPCSLAGCIDGGMKLKKNDKGFCLSCLKYPGCKNSWWLPKFIRAAEVAVDQGPCPQCKNRFGITVMKLNLLITLSMAAPGTPPELTACPCCDSLWRNCGVDGLSLPRIPLSNIGTFGQVVVPDAPQPRSTFAATSAMSAPSVDRTQGGGSFQWHTKASAVTPNSSLQNSWIEPEVVAVMNPNTSDYGAAAVGGDGYKLATNRSRAGGRGRSDQGRGARHFPLSNAEADTDAPLCDCGERTVVRTVVKEGPNKGREFRTCAKQMDEKCKYFEWMDGEASSGGGGRSYSSRGRGAGGGGPSAGRAGGRGGYSGQGFGGRLPPTIGNDADGSARMASIVCSRCKGVGHYARQCPSQT